MEKNSGVHPLIALLESEADPDKALVLQRFFKTDHGEYGHGDVFLGITVPRVRSLLKPFYGLAPKEMRPLFLSPFHEVRLAGLVLLVHAMQSGGRERQKAASWKKEIFETYLWAMGEERVNNWDLVDISAPHVVGRYLHEHEPQKVYMLHDWCRSPGLWTRRIAVVATLYFIRQGQLDTTLALAEKLLQDRHDLIHKAVGWMLREVGKRDSERIESFLAAHSEGMPRTMLRYAIEKFPPHLRKVYLNGGKLR